MAVAKMCNTKSVSLREKAERQGSSVSRNTVQRALVLETVQHLHNHPTSDDVYDALHRHHPNISRATVYRNLGVLARRGEVLRVEVPHGADRYDFFNEPHYHATCRVCGGVFDVDMPYQRDLIDRVENSHGFAIEHCHVIFEGVCKQCQKSS